VYEKPDTNLKLIPNLTLTKFDQEYPVYWVASHGPYEDVKPLIPHLLSLFDFDRERYDLSGITLPLIFGNEIPNLLWSQHLNVPSYGFILDDNEIANIKQKLPTSVKKNFKNVFCVWERTAHGNYVPDLERYVPSYLISFIFDKDVGKTSVIRITSQNRDKVLRIDNEPIIMTGEAQPTKVISLILLEVGDHYRVLTGWFGCFSNQNTYQRLIHDNYKDQYGNPYITEGYAKIGKKQNRWFS
jgi:hypothetical protein